MKPANDHCRACFPHGDMPQRRDFESSFGAMRLFSQLTQGGKAPTMCQDGQDHYRVCHQQTATLHAHQPGKANERCLIR